jgi:hypothetical protein
VWLQVSWQRLVASTWLASGMYTSRRRPALRSEKEENRNSVGRLCSRESASVACRGGYFGEAGVSGVL